MEGPSHFSLGDILTYAFDAPFNFTYQPIRRMKTVEYKPRCIQHTISREHLEQVIEAAERETAAAFYFSTCVHRGKVINADHFIDTTDHGDLLTTVVQSMRDRSRTFVEIEYLTVPGYVRDTQLPSIARIAERLAVKHVLIGLVKSPHVIFQNSGDDRVWQISPSYIDRFRRDLGKEESGKRSTAPRRRMA